MRVTKQFLLSNTTNNGGWTKAQLAVLGVSWPPPKGWQEKVLGKDINFREVKRFEKLKIKKTGPDIKRVYGQLTSRLYELTDHEMIMLHHQLGRILFGEDYDLP